MKMGYVTNGPHYFLKRKEKNLNGQKKFLKYGKHLKLISFQIKLLH